MNTQPAIDLSPVLKFRMGSGIGDGTVNGGIHGEQACLVAQAAILDAVRHGRKISAPTDKLECACPILRRLAIYINDGPWWKSDQERTEILRPLIPLLLDSIGNLATTKKRGLRYVDCWVRELTPIIFDALGQKEAAGKLRALVQIVDQKTITSAREVCAGISTALARDLARALARDITLALARDLDLALDLDLDRDITRDLARALDRALAIALREKLIALFKELAEIKDDSL